MDETGMDETRKDETGKDELRRTTFADYGKFNPNIRPT